jgi:YD repeat-containing protein
VSYDGAGHVGRVADPSGRHVDYGYDAAGNLTDVIDVAGGHTVYTYDANHRLLTIRAPKFYGDTTTTPTPITTNVYDSASRVVAQTDPLGRRTTWSYNDSGTTITDPLGNVTVESFDVVGNLRSVTRGVGTYLAATWGYLYDANDNLMAASDPDGHVSRASWDSRGNQLSSADGLGNRTTYTYDAQNNPLTVIDSLGVTTTMTYDGDRNLASTSAPLVGSSPAAAKLTIYNHGDGAHPGDVTSVTDPNGKVWGFTYDADGDVASATDPLGAKTQYCFDTLGRATGVIAPRGSVSGVTCSTPNPSFTTTISPNAFGDPTAETDPPSVARRPTSTTQTATC